jgi:hypothetical protein
VRFDDEEIRLLTVAAHRARLTETGFVAESAMAAARRRPSPNQLRGLAAIAFDIQDAATSCGERELVELADRLFADIIKLTT